MKPERLWILMAKKKSGEASREELEELRLLLTENPSSGYANEITEKVWQAPLSAIPDSRISASAWERISSRTGQMPGAKLVRLFTLTRSLAAAAVLIVLTLAGIIVYNRYAEKSEPIAVRKNMNHVTTQPGSKSKLELPDGTQVWLNENSKLTYTNSSFGKENREVLLTGEAFFDVVKNEKVPFIIHTGTINITVKGTAFNVKAYPKEKTVETALVRGLVEITTNDDPERKILLKPNEKIVIPVNSGRRGILPGPDSLVTSPYTIIKLQSASKEPAEMAWINTQLVFDNEPFATLAPKMESWYNIRIYFADDNLKNKRFSGVIEKEALKETLEAMQLSFHFNYELKGDELWVGKK